MGKQRLLVHTCFLIFALGFTLVARTQAQWLPLNPVKSSERLPDGVLVSLDNGYLRFQVCSDSIVHVIYSLEREVPTHPDFLVIKKDWAKTDFSPTIPKSLSSAPHKCASK